MQTKGRDEVTTLPYRTIAEGAAIQPARNIGAAVVAGRVLGMLSERGILQALGLGDPAALENASSKHMMAPVVARKRTNAFIRQWKTTTVRRWRHLPAVVDEKLVGFCVDRRRGQTPAGTKRTRA